MKWFARTRQEFLSFQSLKAGSIPVSRALKKAAAHHWFSSLLPRHCELCHGEIHPVDDTSQHYSNVSSNACSKPRSMFCQFCQSALQTPSNYRHCDQCDLPLHQKVDDSLVADIYCGGCLQSAPAYDRILCGHVFSHPVDTLINRFKHQNGHYLVKDLTRALIQRIQFEYFDYPQLILPVPIHWTKRLQRGYNQSDLLAQELSQQLGIPWQRLVRKAHRTSLQQGLKRKQRLRNLKHSFHSNASAKASLSKYDHVVLVDDVVTTGATAEELAKFLKTLGIRRVDVWAIARTPK
ncbi:Orotate phosphoribosyltransferase [Thalassocella blandensis]|nr:Orotate phosphoribosyltransferase [Thalassocella blandensis]